MVQALLDEGKITAEEAESHPQRALLLRAIGGDTPTRPDVSLHEAEAGDRYLLCSDGLTAVASAAAIQETMQAASDPEQAVQGADRPGQRARRPGQHRLRGGRRRRLPGEAQRVAQL